MELRREQTERLYDLLKLRADNLAAGIKIIGIDEMIRRAKVSMTQEDVARVEKLLEESASDRV